MAHGTGFGCRAEGRGELLAIASRGAVLVFLGAVGLVGCGGDEASSGAAPSTGGAASGGNDAVGSGGETSGSGGSGGSVTGSGGSSGGSGSGAILDSITVTVSERQILVNGEPLHLRGVCWNPVGKGGEHPAGLDFAGFAEKDLALMRAIGINAVRTYEPITDRDVLDQLQAAGIFVLNTVYAWGGAAASSAVTPVNAVKDHPAVLAWVIGNEWNYNGLYVGLSYEDSIARVNEVASLVREADPTRPIVSVYGELPSADTVAAMPDIDIWGINVYRGLDFGDLFTQWASRSGKPLFLAEYGADAWNSTTDAYDPDSQAHATSVLTNLLVENSAVYSDGVVSGGTIFEWADEWWKAGQPATQETGGVAPGGGPYPDSTFNEEWWGVVDIDRNPRPAYDELGKIFLELGPTPGTDSN